MKSVTVARIALAAATAALLACALIFDVVTLKPGQDLETIVGPLEAGVSAWRICMTIPVVEEGMEGATSCVSNFNQQCTLVHDWEIGSDAEEVITDSTQKRLENTLCKTTVLAQFAVGSKDYETQLDRLVFQYDPESDRVDKSFSLDKSIGPAISVPFVGSVLAAAAAFAGGGVLEAIKGPTRLVGTVYTLGLVATVLATVIFLVIFYPRSTLVYAVQDLENNARALPLSKRLGVGAYCLLAAMVSGLVLVIIAQRAAAGRA